MSYITDSIAIQAPMSARAAFIRKTYAHLAGAILAFVALEAAMFQIGVAEPILRVMYGSPMAPLILIAFFIGASYLASYWANSSVSKPMQYAGLGLYIIVEALIFLPLLYIAAYKIDDPTIIPTAGILTLAIFGGLTATVFFTGKDYSFLGPIVSIGCFIAIGVVLCAMLFGFSLGLWFSLAMVAIASAAILYDTSNILYRYRTDQYVAASLSLFASVALLFYYVLRILISSRE